MAHGFEVTKGLWISTRREAADPQFFQDHDIRAKLTLRREDDSYSGPPLEHQLHLEVPDGPGFSSAEAIRAYGFLDFMHGLTTLVHCHEGASRSVSVICGYLEVYPDRNDGRHGRGAMPLAKRLREIQGFGLSLPEPSVWESCMTAVEEARKWPH